MNDEKRIWMYATRKVDSCKVVGCFKSVKITQEKSGRFWVNADGQEFVCDKVELETRETK